MKKHKRDPHSIKADQNRFYGNLSENCPPSKAREQMHHKPYAARLIHEQGRQMERKSVEKYLEDKGINIESENRAFLEKIF